jgi:hypothetical protein
MGWWRAADGSAIIGDGPVDELIGAYRRLEAHWRESDRDPSPPSALFGAVRSALLAAGESTWDTQEPTVSWSEAELAIVADALRRIRVEYEESELDRQPTVGELRETVDFVVGELGHRAA